MTSQHSWTTCAGSAISRQGLLVPQYHYQLALGCLLGGAAAVAALVTATSAAKSVTLRVNARIHMPPTLLEVEVEVEAIRGSARYLEV